MATVTVSVPPRHSGAHGGAASQIDPDALPNSLYLPAWRPWLALYGARVRCGGHRRTEEVSNVRTAEYHRCLLPTQRQCSPQNQVFIASLT